MNRQPAYGVGVCLTAHGAVVAVVRADPLRLAAVAEVTGGPTGTRPLSRRLARARRQLGLPRWCTTSMVDVPGLPDDPGGPGGRHAPDRPTASWPEFAALLARAGFLPTAVRAPAQLAHLRRHVELGVGAIVDRRLVEAIADEAHGWATAAALSAFPEPNSSGYGDRQIAGDDPDSDVGQWESSTAENGWAVQRVGASGEREQQTEETPCVSRREV
ncbi:hypothetical protein [Micromonospora sp. C95]|uniref:hypothetical protein n=1 Tax=Micromonospora sp. C95 TaxID=2824882 RepID=UPI001B36370E|nr:hypothetical protein [Micromonospora sp. C95]MBQ1023850.1 hypothetical protein [Micromonospora sp. C95]